MSFLYISAAFASSIGVYSGLDEIREDYVGYLNTRHSGAGHVFTAIDTTLGSPVVSTLQSFDVVIVPISYYPVGHSEIDAYIQQGGRVILGAHYMIGSWYPGNTYYPVGETFPLGWMQHGTAPGLLSMEIPGHPVGQGLGSVYAGDAAWLEVRPGAVELASWSNGGTALAYWWRGEGVVAVANFAEFNHASYAWNSNGWTTDDGDVLFEQFIHFVDTVQVPRVELIGTCPGQMAAVLSGMAPSSPVDIYRAPASTTHTSDAGTYAGATPTGRCSHQSMDLEQSSMRYLGTLRTDAAGAAAVSFTASPSLCGSFAVAMDRRYCHPSEPFVF